MGSVWDGAFSPNVGQTLKKSFSDHIKIRGIEHFDDIVQVSIEFDKSPGEIYIFDIPKERYEYRKEVIAREILAQLGV